MSLPTVIPGVVVSGPSSDGFASQMQYVADVNIDGVLRSGITINRPVIEQWDTIVKPIRRGHAIFGIRVNGVIQWQFRELPQHGPCNGDDGGGAVVVPPGQIGNVPGGPSIGVHRPPMPSPMLRLLMTATHAELVALKRALEALP